jgi:hypothetical protein
MYEKKISAFAVFLKRIFKSSFNHETHPSFFSAGNIENERRYQSAAKYFPGDEEYKN